MRKSSNRYFDKFPTITYGNTSVVDITERVALLKSVSSNPYVYYPYDISESERPDQFSNRYYGDSFKSWILYLTNDMIDPYFDWYMSDEDFSQFIINKYGDYYTPQQKIKQWQNNWAGANNISLSEYDALPPTLLRYWEAQYDAYGNPVSYSRVQQDWTMNTNQIVAYTMSSNAIPYSSDEICSIVFDPVNNVVGNGQVLYTSNNVLYLQHVTGQFNNVVIANTSYVYGTESFANVKLTSVNVVTVNIPLSEQAYWEPVSYFDYEAAQNAFNKTIRILDSDYSKAMVDNLKNILVSNT